MYIFTYIIIYLHIYCRSSSPNPKNATNYRALL